MCESNVYMLKDGVPELVLENVDSLEERGEDVRLVDLFGEEVVVRARVKRLSLVDHRIILEPA